MNGQDRIHIVVVDNNIHQSAGQREKLCKRYKRFSHISVLTITEDGGFSYANNAGYRYARDKDRADWICIINNDVEFTQPEFPDLIEETQKIMKAQESRGVDLKEGKMMERIMAILSLIVPLFVSAFQRADDLANAMEARGYAPGETRTRYKVLKMHSRDYILLLGAVCVLACMIWLSYFR